MKKNLKKFKKKFFKENGKWIDGTSFLVGFDYFKDENIFGIVINYFEDIEFNVFGLFISYISEKDYFKNLDYNELSFEEFININNLIDYIQNKEQK